MPETDRKSKSAIKFNSGNNFWIKSGSSDWENLGNLEAGKLVTDTSENTASFAHGVEMTRGGSTKVSLNIILSQSNLDVLDRIRELNKDVVEVYYYNGDDGGSYDEFYFPECILINKGTINMGGNTQQNYEILLSAVPQDSAASCTPNTDLPLCRKADGTSPVAGADEFYVRLETDIVFSSGYSASFAENGTGTAYSAVAADINNLAITYGISGGVDAALFDINTSSGAVTFLAPPNFEAPADDDTDNVYEIIVSATNGVETVYRAVSITVTDVVE
jgi:hypothetical protein